LREGQELEQLLLLLLAEVAAVVVVRRLGAGRRSESAVGAAGFAELVAGAPAGVVAADADPADADAGAELTVLEAVGWLVVDPLLNEGEGRVLELCVERESRD
jgi:hypothetical protein